MGRNIVAPLLLAIALAFTGCKAVNQSLHSRGLHPNYANSRAFALKGKKALIITTSHAVLSKPGETTGDATGVFGSEMTIPYYEFLDAGMEVHVGSIKGGEIPIDPQSFKAILRSPEDERYLEDEIFQNKVKHSIPLNDLDFTAYDLVFFSGGWGAAYDMGQSALLAEMVSAGYYNSAVIYGSVCHGALAFVQAKDKEGKPLIAGRAMAGVTQKQLDELGIAFTPLHPEAELRKCGADFQSNTADRDFFATITVVDEEGRFVTGQNQNSGHETAQKMMILLEQNIQ